MTLTLSCKDYTSFSMGHYNISHFMINIFIEWEISSISIRSGPWIPPLCWFNIDGILLQLQTIAFEKPFIPKITTWVNLYSYCWIFTQILAMESNINATTCYTFFSLFYCNYLIQQNAQTHCAQPLIANPMHLILLHWYLRFIKSRSSCVENVG